MNDNTEILHDDTLGNNSLDLQQLGSEMNGKTGFISKKEALLERHIREVAAKNKTWVDRMMLPAGEKRLLKGYEEKQAEAISIILESQNKSLAALCSSQVTFVKEVVNTLLKTGRAGLKAGADLIFTEYRNQRAIKMQVLTEQFYDLIERKTIDADKRPPRLKEMKYKEIEIDLKNWQNDYELLQDEFSNILREQV